MQEFDRLFRDFQAIQASELRRRGVFGVELLIDDIKHFGFTEFKFFDIEPFKEVTTARSALEVGFKNSFGIYVRHLLRNTTLTTEEFKEFYSSLYPDEKLRLVTDALLSAATSKSRQYTQFLFESEDPKDQEILFEALSKMHVSHNVDLSVVIRLVGEGLFKSKKAIDRVLNESKIAEKYLEAASTLLNESKSSSGEESKVSAAPAQAKIPFLKGFYENYLGFGGVDPTTGGGYFSFDSLFNMQRAVARGIRYLKILFAIEGESEDFSRIDVLIQVQIKKMIREYYLKMGETDVKKHPQWRIGKETYAEFLQRLPEDLQNTLSESVLAQKSCFPWKGIENTHSLLGQYIQKSKMNSLNPIDPFRQWLDFVDLSQYLILEIETKFLVLEQYFESLPLNSKEKKFMFDLLKEIAVYLSQAKMMPHNGDIVAKLVELHVSAQEKVQRIDKNTIWKNLVEKRENSATSYFKWLKSSPEIGIEVFGENEMSIYQKHSTMRLCKEQTFQLLNTLLTELNEKKRNVYQRLLPIFHQEGKEPFKRWLAQTILYEKYLREINKPDSPHKELLSLADMLDKEPVSVKIEKTRLHLVSSYKYDELNKGLSKIELFKYYDKK